MTFAPALAIKRSVKTQTWAKKLLAATLAVGTVLGSVQPAHANKEDIGTILGAIGGGLLGSRFGNGDGRVVATIGGVIVGAIVGREIGRYMDETDRQALILAQEESFRRPANDRVRWRGGRSGAHGESYWVQEGYHVQYNYQCREYYSTVVAGGRSETVSGHACQFPDGSWRQVENREVVYRTPGGRVIERETTREEWGRGPAHPPMTPEMPYWVVSRQEIRPFLRDLRHQSFDQRKLEVATFLQRDLAVRHRFLSNDDLAEILRHFELDVVRMSALHLLRGVTDVRYGDRRAVVESFELEVNRRQARQILR
jgi:surface antigen